MKPTYNELLREIAGLEGELEELKDEIKAAGDFIPDP
jgi:hypothetical protein